MKSIDVYMGKVKDRLKGMDSMDTENRAISEHKSVSVPDHIPSEYIKDYLRRINNYLKHEAIIAFDTSVDEESDAIQAVQDMEDEHSPCEHRYIARCYILWGKHHQDKWKSSDDHRVYSDGQAQVIGVDLAGIDKQDAISKLDTNTYEFMEWWGGEL